ncbi:MAG: DNA recombination protein RmuC [Candidatus Aminicenantes bacterium]|nr:DNA recombination protein RmuC [Candidatus Aminicenantes bacterium]
MTESTGFLVFGAIGGFVLGVAIAMIIQAVRRRGARAIARELIVQSQTQRVQDVEALLSRVKDAFGALSHDVLSKSTQELLKLANETLSKQTQTGGLELDGKKRLIDQTLEVMKGDLDKVQELIQILEKDREQKFGQLETQLRNHTEQTSRLQETTEHLRQALASTKVRGQWGERMAGDVLNLAGFIEGVNYLKQKALETGPTRPDYTFNLPQGRKVNMDVKFPLDNYVRFLEAGSEMEKDGFKAQFLRDVKNRIKEVTTREYINPEANTLDYVLVFIPNEQVYAFINENDSTILDEALKKKVILCSPITLYAILSVIRQAMENFNLEKTKGQIVALLGGFQKQWEKFVESMDKMGKKIQDAQDEYNKLTTTRRTQLDRQLVRIEELRKVRGIEPAAGLLEDGGHGGEGEDDPNAPSGAVGGVPGTV